MIKKDKNSTKNEKALLYVHGKGGNAAEADQIKDFCVGYDVFGVDYDDYFPWNARISVKNDFDRLKQSYSKVAVAANSIGAYFSMLALQDCDVEKALMVSPVLDMESLICDMMRWEGVTEEKLRIKGEIQTGTGEILSLRYLTYVRENPIRWEIPTEILYGGGDTLISRETVEQFVRAHNARLTVMENGEHWFHTPEQTAFLNDWVKSVMSPHYPDK